MDIRETIKLGKALEGILQDVNDNRKRGVAIGQYLYQSQEKRVLIPESLWNIIVCLDKELEEREYDKKVELDYQSQVFDSVSDCDFRHNCGQCWTAEKLIFAIDGNKYIKIAGRPHTRIECGGTGVGDPAYQFCAVCLRGCIYQYMPLSECYIPEKFYRREMFVFFLYSFDAFYTCFKCCIESGNQSLNAVFKDILWLVFKYHGFSDDQLEEKLKKAPLDGAKFLNVVFNNCRAMGMAGYSELNSVLGQFMMAMRNKGREIVLLLKDNEVKSGKILGDDLLKKMIMDLNKDWLKGG